MLTYWEAFMESPEIKDYWYRHSPVQLLESYHKYLVSQGFVERPTGENGDYRRCFTHGICLHYYFNQWSGWRCIRCMYGEPPC